MASDKSSPMGELDQRLTELRDSQLFDGEQVVAQEMGDQGQAVVITKKRILVLRAGITATGTLNGQKASAFAMTDIQGVTVRKGPMGAVFQIRTSGGQQPAQSAGPPSNVVIFSGSQRVKKCEQLAAKFAALSGKPVQTIEPKGSSETQDEQPKPHDIENEKVVSAPISEPVDDQFTSQEEGQAASDAVDQEDDFTKPAIAAKYDQKMVIPDSIEATADELAAEQDKPQQEKPKRGVERKSLAEEMYAELTQSVEPAPAPTPTPEPTKHNSTEIDALVAEISDPKGSAKSEHELPSEPDTVPETVEVKPDPVVEQKAEKPAEAPPPKRPARKSGAQAKKMQEEDKEFRPNPNLPKPVRRGGGVKGKALTLFAALIGLVVIAVAVMAPMRVTNIPDDLQIEVKDVELQPSEVRKQQEQVNAYKSEIEAALRETQITLNALREAVNAEDRERILTIVKKSSMEQAWQKITELEAPTGLADAKIDLTSGMFILKTVVSDISSRAQSSMPLEKEEVIKRLDTGEKSINSGLGTIDAMLGDLQSKLEEVQKEHNTK